MKRILWVKSDFLHPTTRGGQIRSLEILRRLHQRHEIHYVAYDDGASPEGLARSREYCSYAYPVRQEIASKKSIVFAGQLIAGLFSRIPVSVSRYRSKAMRHQIGKLTAGQSFDAVVCDFPFVAPNLTDLTPVTLFQHNVEAIIWKRHAENAPTFAHAFYFGLQARRMRAYERELCRSVQQVIAVSAADADYMRKQYGVAKICSVPTGVDLEHFAPPPSSPHKADLVFLGSMDWMANIDGIVWFVREILPRIWREKPDCSVAIVGRRPTAAVLRLASEDPRIHVTGTVDDVRPWLWGSHVSIVPLRVGGGTRLKIFEAQAARIPVVSTTIGAEGLDLEEGRHLLIADQPEAFARHCLSMLDEASERQGLSNAAWDFISARFSWETVSQAFERCLGWP
jgi:polysaccharide biosynthesis protein PslH